MLHNAAILMRTIWTYQYDRIILYNKSYNNNTFRTISGGVYMIIGFVGLGIMGIAAMVEIFILSLIL